MRDVYLSHFGLREPPFSKEIPDGDLWLPSSKQAVVDELVDAVEEHTSVVLVGDPGVGKTCVLRAFRKRLPEAAYRLTYCHNVTLGRRDFYRQLCIALGLSPSVTAAGVFHAVATHVNDLGKDRIHPVFLLDEAHLLHQDTLDHLHILLNYEWDSRALLSLEFIRIEMMDRFPIASRGNGAGFTLALAKGIESGKFKAVPSQFKIPLRVCCKKGLFTPRMISWKSRSPSSHAFNI